MAAPYAFRYTLVDEATDALVLKWIVAKSPGHVVVCHDADDDCNRVHWHALMWSDKKLDALRKDWIKAKPDAVGKGNAAYSLTDVKKKTEEDPVEAYERYICHGACEGDTVHVVSSQGLKYTKEWFAEQNKAYYAKQKEFRKKEAKQACALNMVNELLKVVQAAGMKERSDIALKLVRMLAAERRAINTFYARNVVNTVWVIVNGKEAEFELAREIAGRF